MYLKFKRLFDFLISFAILLLLFPLFIIVAVLIKLDSKGPIFYLQSRVGENGRVFRIYKLRTMTNKERDPNVKQTYLQDSRGVLRLKSCLKYGMCLSVICL